MDIFLIRHGQSANNSLGDIRNREVDPPLTDLGQQQANILAQHLATGLTHDVIISPIMGTSNPQVREGYGITYLYCSPMYRSLQTARPVAQALGLAPELWIEIHERGGMYLNHGEPEGFVGYPGRTSSEIAGEFPEYKLTPGITDQGWWTGGFEDAAGCAARAMRVASDLLARVHTEDRVAVITHGNFMDVVLKALLNQLPSDHIYYRHHNTAITRISISAGNPVDIRSLNRVDHLPVDLVS